MTTTTPGRYRRFPNPPARRGDPLAEFEQLQEQMGQIINSFLRGDQNLGWRLTSTVLGAGGRP